MSSPSSSLAPRLRAPNLFHGLGITTLLLVGLALFIQFSAITAIFLSRTHFGSDFNPSVYSTFQRERSSEAVKDTFGISKAMAARLASKVSVQDDVSLAVQHANQELSLVKERQTKNQDLRRQAEKRADTIMQQAGTLWKKGSFQQAIDQLRVALQIAPDYLPPTRRLAEFYEQQFNFGQARFQWEKAASLADLQGSEIIEIQEHIARLTQLELSSKLSKNPSSSLLKGDSLLGLAPTENSSLISLGGIKRTELPLNDTHDMRFKLEIVLSSSRKDPLDITQTRVEITFYDQTTTASGDIVPVKVLTTTLQPKGTWNQGDDQILSLNYAVPFGYYRKKAETLGDSYKFCGYVVRAFYSGHLQETYCQPSHPLGKLASNLSNSEGKM
jgi:tetratricopeptide (TPR) repeat protein